VGENLHDHPNIQLFFRGRRDVDCHYPQLYGFHRARPQSELREGQSDTCYVFYPARSSFREGLMRMLPAMTLSPTLYHDTPIPQLMRHAIGGTFKSKQVRNFVARMYGIVVILGKPQSRGTVRLRSSNPKDGALLDPAYFTEPEDMQTLLAGVHLGRRIAAADPLAQWGNTELMPGRWVRSEKRLQSFIEKNVMTTYHYAGTCRMGEDERAVLDPQLRVRGVRGLRVADASAIPYTPVSAMNAPSMLIGYRAARFIRQSGKVSS
jgi:choline dehydrogenase